MQRQHRGSDGCCEWSRHPTAPTLSCSETWVSSASCSAALIGYNCSWKSVGELPASERQLHLLPAVFRGSISRSAFPAESPAAHASSFHSRRMAGKRRRLLTPSSLICWSWILFCLEALMVSASRESVSDTPSLLFILVRSQLSYFQQRRTYLRELQFAVIIFFSVFLCDNYSHKYHCFTSAQQRALCFCAQSQSSTLGLLGKDNGSICYYQAHSSYGAVKASSSSPVSMPY